MRYIFKQVLFFLFFYTISTAKIFQGYIFDKQLREPISNANIFYFQNNKKFTAISDRNGYFYFELKNIDSVGITISHISYKDTTLFLKSGRAIRIYLELASIQLEAVEVEEHYDDVAQPLTYNIRANLQNRMPSMFSNIFYSVKSLPGVISNNEFSNRYNVHGGNFNENSIYINRLEIFQPIITRRSIQENQGLINPYMIKNFTFDTDISNVNSGDKISSVLNIFYRDSSPEVFAGHFHLSLIEQNFTFDFQPSGKFHIMSGIRYSNLKNMFSSYKLKGTYIPEHFDFQINLDYRINEKWFLNILSIYSNQVFSLIPESKKVTFQDNFLFNFVDVFFDFEGVEKAKFNLALNGFNLVFNINENTKLHQVINFYNSKENVTSDIVTKMFFSNIDYTNESDNGYKNEKHESIVDINGNVLDFSQSKNIHNIYDRFNLGIFRYLIDLNKKKSFSAGIEYSAYSISDSLNEFNIDSNAIVKNNNFAIKFNDSYNSQKIAGYFSKYSKFNKFNIILGLRGFYTDINNEFFLSPRFQISFDSFLNSLIYLNAGYFAQPPFFREAGRYFSIERLKKLKSQKSLQITSGIKFFDKKNRLLKIEFYYKYLVDLISYQFNDLQIIYSGKNDAKGYAYGFDFFMGGNLSHSMYSWLTYSYLDTKEDIKGDGLGYLPRPTEQKHTFTFFAQDQLKGFPSWKTSLKLVFGSGYVNYYKKKEYDKNSMSIVLIDNKRLYDYNPFYFRLDISIFKEFKIFKDKKAILSFKVLNMFNRLNVQFYQYISDPTGKIVLLPQYLLPRSFNISFDISF